MLLLQANIIHPETNALTECVFDCDTGTCYIDAGNRTFVQVPSGGIVKLENAYAGIKETLIQLSLAEMDRNQ